MRAPFLTALIGFIMLATLALSGAACVPGTHTYPLDIFPEMHYSPSYRPQEPPRVLPPADTIPMGSTEVAVASAADAARLANPVPRSQQVIDRGREIYRVNCVPCHGAEAKGNGIVAASFRSAQATPPPDLTSAEIRARSDGDLFWVITNGKHDPQTLVGMPAFKGLLAAEDRWALIHHIRSLQGQ